MKWKMVARMVQALSTHRMTRYWWTRPERQEGNHAELLQQNTE